MKIPVVTGTGERFEIDSNDYLRLVLLPEVCSEIDPRLWDMFTSTLTAREPDDCPPARRRRAGS